MTDGRSLSGLNPRDSAALLTLTDASGTELSVPREQVKSVTTSPLSLMPAVFDTVLSEQEFADLIAFLTQPAP